MAKAIVYVDGFNLYYGCLRHPGLRWLDLSQFSQRMLPRDSIVGIKYFTARVTARPNDPDAPNRQKAYLRVLQTIPNLTIYYGQFLTTEIWARRVHPPRVGRATVKVFKTEEKGSDVNLATQLLVDGFTKRYELAVVVSNDGDLKDPVEYVRHELALPVGVLNPRKNRSYALSPPKLPKGSFYKPIRRGVLSSSQFPASITDGDGTFTKPAAW
jgi:hypothetical protein